MATWTPNNFSGSTVNWRSLKP